MSDSESASTSLSTSDTDSTSASTSMSGSGSDSTSASTSVNTSESVTSNNGSESAVNSHKEKVELPDTGKDTDNRNGLVGATLAMLAGLGLIRKSRKNKKESKK
ncbi:LPXTG cell wall anchor domain-containing protein [Staphylococcus chromogenes]|uniref:LPXTG cell wall anchor domain-containing protein n=1 Tax=Staphylococcus chromogenes TaxID=46126 RepID=UPI00188E8830|nr:LPXTG cell wall anchor domain-containing protein [Staphylococcus chromogenes]